MHFLSLDIINTRYQDFLGTLFSPTRPTLIFTPNPEMLLRAARDTEFLAILSQADVLTPDANGLYTASLMQEGSGFLSACLQTLTMKKQLRAKYGDIITGSNLTRDLVSHAIESGKKILMIDNYRITDPQNPFEIEKKSVQSHLRELFRERFPRLDIAVFFDREESPQELATYIQEQHISYVFSCIGMKAQEQRLIEIWAHLPSDQRVVGLGVGSSFDYLLGLQKRAPIFVQKLGLEWLYRLALSPRARWHRIVDAFYRFPQMIQDTPK